MDESFGVTGPAEANSTNEVLSLLEHSSLEDSTTYTEYLEARTNIDLYEPTYPVYISGFVSSHRASAWRRAGRRILRVALTRPIT